MMKWLSTGVIIKTLKQQAAGKLFLFLFLFIGNNLFSQSYYYFETSTPASAGATINYFTFLVVENEGTATARILYAAASGETHLVELKLTDSSATTAAGAEIVYLVATGGVQVIIGNDDAGFITPRFILQQQGENKESFYFPSGIEYKGTEGGWYAARLIVNQQKTSADLRADNDFVSRFFNTSDAFYRSLFFVQSRGSEKPQRKEKMFLIAVANTKDSAIGVTTKVDLDNITKTFTELASDLEISIVTTSISGEAFGKRAVESAINRLTPSPSDIVVFYYSGHGFRYSNDVSKFPRISLRKSKDQDIDLNNLRIEDVYNRIVKKGARVNIVLGDCCNNDIGSVAAVGRKILRMRGGLRGGGPELNLENCNALFFPDHKVSILSTSAEASQLASGNPEFGGFFTAYFKIFLDKSLYGFESSTSWIKLMTDASEKTQRQALTALCGDDRCVQRAEISVTPLQ